MQQLRFRREAAIVALAMCLVALVFFGLYGYARYQRVLSLERLEKRFIPGLYGVTMHAAESVSFDPWDALEQNRSLTTMLQKLCGKINQDASCYKDDAVWFELFVKGHTITHDGADVVLVRGALPVTEMDVTRERIESSLRLMLHWVANNQNVHGSLPYSYTPSQGTYGDGNNVIRQMITVQGLYALGNLLNDPRAIKAADRAAQLVLAEHLVDTGAIAYMKEGDVVKLGATALTLLAMREKDFAAPPSRLESALAEHLLRAQRPDGSFQTMLQETPTDENDRFYSGEALTGIARMLPTGDVRFTDALQRSLPYYRTKLEAEWYPQYAPWHMQAYAIAYESNPNEAYAEYVFWLADRLIATMLEADEDALPDERGRFYNPGHPEWGPPHSSSTGIYTEGLTYAYALAESRGDTARASRYRAAMTAGTRAMLQVQWTPESAYYLTFPDRVVGTLKRTVTDNRHRVDQLGHAMNALVRVYTLLTPVDTSTL